MAAAGPWRLDRPKRETKIQVVLLERGRAGAVADILNWLNNAQLPHTVVPVAAACAGCGAIVLSRFTRWLGPLTLLFNGVALFVGAYGANLLLSGVYMPLNRFIERPLLVSFIGMTVMSIPLLMISQRRSNQ